MHVVGNCADVGNKMELLMVVGQIVGNVREIALAQQAPALFTQCKV